MLSYVINLDRSTARMDATGDSLRAEGMAFERVSAFDGRKLDLSQEDRLDAAAMRRLMGRDMLPSEYGCSRSHLAAIQQFVDSGAPAGLVLEDDIAMVPGAGPLIEDLLAVLDARTPGWRVVNLSRAAQKIHDPVTPFGPDKTHMLVAAHYMPMLASALIWSRQGAVDFLKSNHNVTAPFDNMVQDFHCRTGGGFSVDPVLVTLRDVESDISPGGADAVVQRGHHGRYWHYGFSKQKRLWTNKFHAMRCRTKWRAAT